MTSYEQGYNKYKDQDGYVIKQTKNEYGGFD